METHSSTLAWRIPGMGDPGGLPSMGSHTVGHDWSNLAAAAAAEVLPKWIDKQIVVLTIEYYSVLQINELSSHEKKWKNPNGILLSEINKSEKAAWCRSPAIWHSGKGKTMETVKRSMAPSRREGWIGRAQKIFREVKLLCIVLWRWMRITIHLSTTPVSMLILRETMPVLEWGVYGQ